MRHYDISRAHFQGTTQRLIYVKLEAEDRQKYGEDKVGKMIQIMYGTQNGSHLATVCCVGGFRSGKHSAALFYNPKEAVRMSACRDSRDSRESPRES